MRLWPLGKVKQKRGEEMKMRALLVESDQKRRAQLWNLLRMYQVFTLADEADTSEEAVTLLQKQKVDVVFCNHQPAPPNRTSTGDWLATVLAQNQPDIQVVMYADTTEWAFEAYRSQCAGYLLLPFDPLALQALVNRLRYVFDLQQTKREAANRSLLIKTRSGYQFTPVNDILFVERSNRKNRIVTQSGAEIHPLGYSMSQLEQMLEGCGFYRCYQSFIVNLSKVSFIRADGNSKTYAIQFDGYDGEILLSRDKYPELIALLKENTPTLTFEKPACRGHLSISRQAGCYCYSFGFGAGGEALAGLPLSTSRWSSAG